jgi:hypothetical protein
MFRLLILILVFITGCSTTSELNPIDRISGVWTFTEKGTDFENSKSCSFLSLGELTCSISEAGFSNGYGDAESYQTKGSWSIKNDSLILKETPTFNPKQSINNQYSFKSFTLSKMTLLNSNGSTEVWYKKN